MSALLVAEVIQWRRCDDELPESGEMVLTYSPGSSDVVWMGYYVPDHKATMTGKVVGTWFRPYGDDHRKLVVEAWSPLPTGRSLGAQS